MSSLVSHTDEIIQVDMVPVERALNGDGQVFEVVNVDSDSFLLLIESIAGIGALIAVHDAASDGDVVTIL